MPVIDHGQHASTAKIKDDHRYGCFNRHHHFRPSHKAQDGWWNDGLEMTAKATLVPFRMSHECRYDRSVSDSACQGCTHQGSGEAYIKAQEAKGAR